MPARPQNNEGTPVVSTYTADWGGTHNTTINVPSFGEGCFVTVSVMIRGYTISNNNITATLQGTSMTEITSGWGGGSQTTSRHFILAPTSTGVLNVQVLHNNGSSPDPTLIWCIAWEGVDDESPIVGFSNSTGTTANPAYATNLYSITDDSDDAIVAVFGSIIDSESMLSTFGDNPIYSSRITNAEPTIRSGGTNTFDISLSSGGSPTGQIKTWTGTAWVAKPVKVWNGTSWVTKPVKYWNGSSWITTTY
jgi:hypothetical protein